MCNTFIQIHLSVGIHLTSLAFGVVVMGVQADPRKNDMRLDHQRFLVTEDHAMTLDGILLHLERQYPDAEFLVARTAQQALEQVTSHQPVLAIVDLALPESDTEAAKADVRPHTGIILLKTLMEKYPTLNITVQSNAVKSLLRIRQLIEDHEGGFTTVDKSLPTREMLQRIDWALQGITHTKDIRGSKKRIEVRPEWLTLLKFAFDEGLKDQAIAEKMNCSLRTVRCHWTKLQDALDIYPDSHGKKLLRIQTGIRAREIGLID